MFEKHVIKFSGPNQVKLALALYPIFEWRPSTDLYLRPLLHDLYTTALYVIRLNEFWIHHKSEANLKFYIAHHFGIFYDTKQTKHCPTQNTTKKFIIWFKRVKFHNSYFPSSFGKLKPFNKKAYIIMANR